MHGGTSAKICLYCLLGINLFRLSAAIPATIKIAPRVDPN